MTGVDRDGRGEVGPRTFLSPRSTFPSTYTEGREGTRPFHLEGGPPRPVRTAVGVGVGSRRVDAPLRPRLGP